MVFSDSSPIMTLRHLVVKLLYMRNYSTGRPFRPFRDQLRHGEHLVPVIYTTVSFRKPINLKSSSLSAPFSLRRPFDVQRYDNAFAPFIQFPYKLQKNLAIYENYQLLSFLPSDV